MNKRVFTVIKEGRGVNHDTLCDLIAFKKDTWIDS